MAELCNLVHRYASTSTAIIVTVRLFARSSAPHGEHKRSKSLVRTIGCGVLPLVLGWRCVRVCQTSAEWTSTRPSSKQRSAPRRPLWCSKVTFNGSFRRKTAQGWSMYAFCSFGWPSGPSRVDTGRVRSFACFFNALSHEKGLIFCLWGSLWRLFGSNTGEICTERSCFMYEMVMGWFWWSVGTRAFCSCLPYGQRRRVFCHIKVSRRGQERVASSQMGTTARPCACGRTWLRLERGCAMMRSLIDT